MPDKDPHDIGVFAMFAEAAERAIEELDALQRRPDGTYILPRYEFKDIRKDMTSVAKFLYALERVQTDKTRKEPTDA